MWNSEKSDFLKGLYSFAFRILVLVILLRLSDSFPDYLILVFRHNIKSMRLRTQLFLQRVNSKYSIVLLKADLAKQA